MRLSEFILENLEPILDDWSDFARTIPAAAPMDVDELRDHAALILRSIAQEMLAPQTEQQQLDKSRGLQPRNSPADTDAEKHGADRHRHGFGLVQMVAEYRALRAAVVRRWMAQLAAPERLSPARLDELIRFNEGIDKALTESSERFMHDLDEARELLLGVIAHDLRSPVGAIVQSGLYLQVSDGLRSDQARCADVVVRSGRRLARLVSNLLEFTRIRLRGTARLSPRQTDLARVCEVVLQEAQALHPGGMYLVEMNGDTTGHWDSTRLEQVVSNLVENAYKHGTADRPVELRAHGERDAVQLRVHSEGVIPPERLPTLFEPMVTWSSDRSERLPSYGLGLHIVREVVQAHGGEVRVQSTAETGTVFTVHLPRRVPGNEPAPQPVA